MYKLPYFNEPDSEKVFEFMKKYPFAILTGMLGGIPVATHLPLDIKKQEDTLVFTGHMMKATDHYKAFAENENALAIFTGPHCYVSASWYEKTNVASTWNYMDVHARGKIKFTDEEGTLKIIEDITNQYEAPGSSAAFGKLPKEYIDRLSGAIRGFHMEVESIDPVFKLSQNHSSGTCRQIIANLRNRDDYFSLEISREMESRQLAD
jgi:transcriptional regulator